MQVDLKEAAPGFFEALFGGSSEAWSPDRGPEKGDLVAEIPPGAKEESPGIRGEALLIPPPVQQPVFGEQRDFTAYSTYYLGEKGDPLSMYSIEHSKSRRTLTESQARCFCICHSELAQSLGQHKFEI